MSPYDSRAHHVVTAVVVAHDGARWLPAVAAALHAQTRPVQRVVGVDTGSRDRSGAVLAEVLGTGSVFGTERDTGFGAAVAQALRQRAASAQVSGPAGPLPAQDAVEWIWLLHDDCAPERDALEQLLRVAAEGRFAVLGPKVRQWEDPRILIEAGLRIDTSGRRETGLEPDEYDQGQHDGDRDVLAVGSAGMLVRRDVWDSLGGFDPALPLFRDDIDFCWRANAAGHRVRLVTGAVIRHVKASANGRRTVSAGELAGVVPGLPAAARSRRAERSSGLYVVLANLPLGPMLISVLGNMAGSLLRAIVALTVVKRPAAAWDEIAALGAVLGHPLRLILARRRRPSGRRRTYRLFRSSLPRGRALAMFTEIAALAPSRAGKRRTGPRDDGAPGGLAGGSAAADDDVPTDGGRAHRLMTSPGVITAAVLVVITLLAERSLIGGGPLGGGALVPASGGASSLWHEYVTGFHNTGIGSAAPAPPYVAVLAAVATVLGGKSWLAMDVLLLGSVPLAGLTAYFAARRITTCVPARVWAAASYALLPAATGAVAAGRIGTAVTITLIPVIGVLAGRVVTGRGRVARRAAWATGLTVAVAAAFVPLVWALTAGSAVLAVLAVLARGGGSRTMVINLAIATFVPAALLFPWTLQLFAHPSLFLVEAGIPRASLSDPRLPGSSMLLLSPGGPGVPSTWVTAGLGVAGLAALLLRRHRVMVAAGWAVALAGLLFAIVVSRISVVPPGAGQAVYGWPGVPLVLAAAGILLAAAAAGESVALLLRSGGTGGPESGGPDAAQAASPESADADPPGWADAGPPGWADGGPPESADADPPESAAADKPGRAGADRPGHRLRGHTSHSAPRSRGIQSIPSIRAIPGVRAVRSVRGIASVPALRSVPGIPSTRRIRGLRGVRAIRSVRGIPGVRSIGGSPGRLRWRRACGALVAVAACSAPVLAAGSWIVHGAARPVTRADSPALPALASLSSGSGTLVLRPGPATLTYSVIRGTAPPPGEPQLTEPAAARRQLDAIVAGLTSGSGGDIGADGSALTSFGIGYVVLPAPVDQRLARVLDGTPGIRQLSFSSAFGLWSVAGVTARVRVVEPGGAVVPVPSGSINVTGAAAPGQGGTLVLAEPADGGWHASLNGQPLAPLPEPPGGWAQGFRLPPGGGRLDVSRDMTGRHLSVMAEGLALLVVAGLAFPGLGAAAVEGEGADGPGPAGAPPGANTHARRRGRSARHGTHGRGARAGRRRPARVPVSAPAPAPDAAARRAETRAGTPAGMRGDIQTRTEAGAPAGTEAGTPAGTPVGTEPGTPADSANRSGGELSR